MGTLIKDQKFVRPEHSYVILNQQSEPITTLNESDDFVCSDNHDGDSFEQQDKPNSAFVAGMSNRAGSSFKSRLSDLTLKLSSALFYGICSFLITVINKIVLTSYGFPSASLLAAGQMIAILLVLKMASLFRLVTVRRLSLRNQKLWILAFFYIGNLISGLEGTKILSLPMLIALRRFSIAMTAVAEFYLLNVRQSLPIIMTIVAMILGSFIAAAADLTFNARGYVLVMVNNFFTAANGVYIKKTIESHEINKHEILFYNALFSILPQILICYITSNAESLYAFQYWSNLGFIVSFLASCFMGYLLTFSTVLCTHYNSALTTTIVGTLKNILTTYVGMYVGGDYKFNQLNFIGINVSLVGSLVYSYLTFSSNMRPHKDQLRQVNKLSEISN